MIKTLLSAALIAGLGIAALAPQAARASDGSITFNGKVLNSTCTVSNASSGVVAVTLPDVQSSAFTAQGATAGQTPFSLNLTGCPTTPSGVSVGATFSGASIDTSTGAIQNTSGTGYSNVEVQMTNATGTAIDLNNQPKFGPVTANVSASGVATLSYQAQYYQPTATAVSAGAVTASVFYTLTYN